MIRGFLWEQLLKTLEEYLELLHKILTISVSSKKFLCEREQVVSQRLNCILIGDSCR